MTVQAGPGVGNEYMIPEEILLLYREGGQRQAAAIALVCCISGILNKRIKTKKKPAAPSSPTILPLRATLRHDCVEGWCFGPAVVAVAVIALAVLGLLVVLAWV